MVGKLNLTSTPTKEDDKNLKIIVKQDEKTYTQGPYTISFANQNVGAICGSETMGELVYKEITEKNVGYSRANAYCIGDIGAEIKFEDGTKTIVDGSEITILDMNEQPMEHNFPMFGKKFLIKYNSHDKDIKEIRPLIRLTYLNKITNKGKILRTFTYKSESMRFEMLQDQAWIFREALAACGLLTPHAYSNEQPFWLIERKDHYSSIFAECWHYMYGDVDLFEFANEKMLKNITDKLRDKITEILNSWGIGGVIVDFGTETGLTNTAIEGSFSKLTVNPTHKETSEKVDDEWDEETGEATHWYYTAKSEALNCYPPGIDSSSLIGRSSGETRELAEQAAFNDLLSKLTGIDLVVKINRITISCKIGKIQPCVVLEPDEDDTDLWGFWGTLTRWQLDPDRAFTYSDTPDHVVERTKLHGREINMFIGGNVWQDMPSEKLGEFTGKRAKNSLAMAGIQVELYDKKDDKLWSVTTTDEHGEYGFQKLNPMHKYYIVFRYDGMRYDDTDFNNKLTGGYSTAKEKASDRKDFNEKFSQIGSSPNNYDGNKKAYRSVHKARK